MLLALALYASTAHAASPPDSVERPASSTRTRRTTTSSCWGVKARMARGENLPSSPSDSAPRRGRGQGSRVRYHFSYRPNRGMSAGVPQASVAAVSRFANRAAFSSRVRLRTHFVVGVGTGETLTGAGRRLKEHDPRIKIVSIVPEIFSGIVGLKPVGRRSRECE